MALQIAERAVVGQHVEPVVDPLEAAAWLVAAVAAIADVGAHQRHPLVGAQLAHPLEQRQLRQIGVRVADRGEQLVLAVGVEVDELHLGHRVDRRAPEQLVDEVGGRLASVGEILAPETAAVGQVDPAQKARDHLAQFDAASGRRSAPPRGAGGRACAAATLRTPGRCRRRRRSRGSPPAACRGSRRAPSRGWLGGTRTRCRRGRARSCRGRGW